MKYGVRYCKEYDNDSLGSCFQKIIQLMDDGFCITNGESLIARCEVCMIPYDLAGRKGCLWWYLTSRANDTETVQSFLNQYYGGKACEKSVERTLFAKQRMGDLKQVKSMRPPQLQYGEGKRIEQDPADGQG